MKSVAKTISFVALAMTIAPCLLYFWGVVGQDAVKWTTLAGTGAWFAATPFWMRGEGPVDAAEVEI